MLAVRLIWRVLRNWPDYIMVQSVLASRHSAAHACYHARQQWLFVCLPFGQHSTCVIVLAIGACSVPRTEPLVMLHSMACIKFQGAFDLPSLSEAY